MWKRQWPKRSLYITAAVLVGATALVLLGETVFTDGFTYTSATTKPEKSEPKPQVAGDKTPAAQTPQISAFKYGVHTKVKATVFWIGEDATPDNSFIDNAQSAWADDWVAVYGGVDNPRQRVGYHPAAFTPKENPFYFALPYYDYSKGVPRADLRVVPWAKGALKPGESILKNRWVAVRIGERVAYAQWEDVGPYFEDDEGYVFGKATPKYAKAGIDLSPATADYLNMDGHHEVDWWFVDDVDVPDGPWKKIVTTSPPTWK